MSRRKTLRGVTAAIGAAALTIPVGYVATAAAAPSPATHTLPGTHPSWAIPSRVVASPAASARLTVDVALRMRDESGALALLRSVSDPSSAQYGRYLTTTQFNTQFAPTSGAVAEVQQYLRSQGLTLHAVPSNHRYVEATGSPAQIERAFGTSLHVYRYDGVTEVAPDHALSVPESLAGTVLTVTGLADPIMHTDQAETAPASASPGMKVPPASQCSDYWNQHTQTVPTAYGKTVFPTYICGYLASQYQSAYGTKHAIALGHDGRGTKVAIVDAYASPTVLADANQLFTDTGEPVFKAQQFSQQKFRPFTRKKVCGGSGWWGEESLDVEAVHAMAPGAKELYVGAQNCGGGLNRALNWIASNVDNPQSKAYGVSMISDSWGDTGEDGLPQSYVDATNAIFVQAGLEGIGVYFSSGDSGDESTLGHTSTPQPDFPASSPYVTGVGGTSLAINAKSGIKFQTGWGTDLDKVNVSGSKEKGYQEALPGDFEYGAGGGTSHLFRQPWYQRHIVSDKLSKSYDGRRDRVVPDVAMDADPYTGMLEGQTVDGTYTEYGIGGTSLACPLMVGLQASVQGRGTHIGFANPVLYELTSNAFHDIVSTAHPVGVTNPSGSYLVTLDRDSTLQTEPGYDNVTGLGSPNGAAFLAAEWAAVNHK